MYVRAVPCIAVPCSVAQFCDATGVLQPDVLSAIFAADECVWDVDGKLTADGVRALARALDVRVTIDD